MIEGGEPLRSNESEVARVYRFKKGSGPPLKVSAIEMIEVGPRSAGSEPGPARHGRGGTEPTVTDADLILGYFDPVFFLGGRCGSTGTPPCGRSKERSHAL